MIKRGVPILLALALGGATEAAAAPPGLDGYMERWFDFTAIGEDGRRHSAIVLGRTDERGYSLSLGELDLALSLDRRALADAEGSLDRAGLALSWRNLGFDIVYGAPGGGGAPGLRGAAPTERSIAAEDWNFWDAGLRYRIGPLAASLRYLQRDRGDEDRQSALMLSARVRLAPGVAAEGALLQAENETARPAADPGQDDADLVAFFAGIRIDL